MSEAKTPPEKQLWIATTNRGKMIEFQTLLTQSGFELHGLPELANYSAPPETGKTYEENARIKAKSLKAMKPGTWVVGEDSGIEVAGLNQLPGIHSARYAGEKASDAENNAKMIKMVNLRSANNRKAAFKCTIVAYSPNGQEHVIVCEYTGNISPNARGKDGFGYDVLFIPEGQTLTLAELGMTFKNKVSHRAQAIRKLSEILKTGGAI